MSNRFKKWAKKTTAPNGTSLRRNFEGPSIQPIQPAPQLVTPHGHPVVNQPGIVAPQPQPRGVAVYAPAPAPTYVQFAQGGVGNYAPGPMEIDPIPSVNVIVKPDAEAGDPYERFMAMVPDIAKAHGLDLANGFDAMELAGLPSGVAVEDWQPTSRYYNGVTDQSAAGRLESAFGRHQVSGGSVRSDRGMANSGIQQATRDRMTWQPPQQ